MFNVLMKREAVLVSFWEHYLPLALYGHVPTSLIEAKC